MPRCSTSRARSTWRTCAPRSRRSATSSRAAQLEQYEPCFTFQGFRYVAVKGLRGEPDPDLLTALVIHSDMEPAGEFECSEPLLNQLQHNIVWGQKGNFLDVPTDCPQRDERLGWTGDAQVFSRTACFNFDVAAFFTKWLGDLAADQRPDGRVPHVVPDIMYAEGERGAGATAWADAAVIVPWTDVPVLRRHAHPRAAVRQHGQVGRVHAPLG